MDGLAALFVAAPHAPTPFDPDSSPTCPLAKGVRKAGARSTGATRLKLPIKPVGKAKRQLARTGAIKLQLRLAFLPVGGTTGTVTKSVKLTER